MTKEKAVVATFAFPQRFDGFDVVFGAIDPVVNEFLRIHLN
jgi:hypothetical protein